MNDDVKWDIFNDDIREEGIREYLEELAEERAAKRALAELDASFSWTEGRRK